MIKMSGLFKKTNNSSFENVNRENVNDYIRNGELKVIYLISPDFGGSEGIDNQTIVTPKAEREKSMIDDELYNFLANGKSVKNFNCNLDYKGNSIVPSKIIITAIVDGTDYKKIVEIW